MNASVSVLCYKYKTLSNGEHPLCWEFIKTARENWLVWVSLFNTIFGILINTNLDLFLVGQRDAFDALVVNDQPFQVSFQIAVPEISGVVFDSLKADFEKFIKEKMPTAKIYWSNIDTVHAYIESLWEFIALYSILIFDLQHFYPESKADY